MQDLLNIARRLRRPNITIPWTDPRVVWTGSVVGLFVSMTSRCGGTLSAGFIWPTCTSWFTPLAVCDIEIVEIRSLSICVCVCVVRCWDKYKDSSRTFTLACNAKGHSLLLLCLISCHAFYIQSPLQSGVDSGGGALWIRAGRIWDHRRTCVTVGRNARQT